MKDKLTLALKVTVSLGLMAYLFYRFLSNPHDRELLLTTLTTANYWYLVLAVILFMFAIFTNAVKWYILLRAQNIEVSLKDVTALTFVGFFFNNFLPANIGGDLVRGYGLARDTHRNAESAVSVVVDRIIGLAAFMFTALVSALIALYLAYTSQTLGGEALINTLLQLTVLTVAGMTAIVMGFSVALSRRLRNLMGQFFEIKLLKPAAPLYWGVANAFGAYRHKYMALFLSFTVGVGTVLITGVIDVVLVAGLGGQVDPIYIFLFNPIIAILLILPISIGGLGTGSVLYVYFYGLVGMAEALAFALSLVKQLTIYLGSLLGGILWLRSRRKPQPDDVEETDNLADIPAG